MPPSGNEESLHLKKIDIMFRDVTEGPRENMTNLYFELVMF